MSGGFDNNINMLPITSTTAAAPPSPCRKNIPIFNITSVWILIPRPCGENEKCRRDDSRFCQNVAELKSFLIFSAPQTAGNLILFGYNVLFVWVGVGRQEQKRRLSTRHTKKLIINTEKIWEILNWILTAASPVSSQATCSESPPIVRPENTNICGEISTSGGEKLSLAV